MQNFISQFKNMNIQTIGGIIAAIIAAVGLIAGVASSSTPQSGGSSTSSSPFNSDPSYVQEFRATPSPRMLTVRLKHRPKVTSRATLVSTTPRSSHRTSTLYPKCGSSRQLRLLKLALRMQRIATFRLAPAGRQALVSSMICRKALS